MSERETVSVTRDYLEALEEFAEGFHIHTVSGGAMEIPAFNDGARPAILSDALRRIHALRPKPPDAIDVLTHLVVGLKAMWKASLPKSALGEDGLPAYDPSGLAPFVRVACRIIEAQDKGER